MGERKTSSVAKLDNLSAARQEQIFEWCNTATERDPETDEPLAGSGGLIFARKKLAAEGFKVSLGALSRWHRRFAMKVRMRELRENADARREEMLQFDPADVERARKFGQWTFIEHAIKTEDPETFRLMSRDVQEMNSLAHQRERFEFDASKAVLKHVSEIKGIAGNRALDDQQKIDAVRLRLFGAAPLKEVAA